jgi:hypothetical protein
MSVTFAKGFEEILKQSLDLVGSGDVVAVPMSSSYTPDPDNHTFMSDVNGDELNADGYIGGFGGAGRLTPTGRVLRVDNADNPTRVEFDHDDFTLADIGGGVSDNNDTLGGFLYIEERTSDADSPVIGFDSLQDDRATNGSDITRSTAGDGAFYVEVG